MLRDEGHEAIAGDVASRAGAVPRGDPAARTWDTRVLFDSAREVRIVHGGVEYRLRITRNEKLILVK